MQSIYGFPPPQNHCFPPYIQWAGENAILSSVECEKLIEIGESKPLGFGTIGNGDHPADIRADVSYRCVKTRALTFHEDKLSWLFSRIRQRVMWANNDYYRFVLSGLQEDVQFLKYEMPEGEKPAGHYNWHQDFGGGTSSTRKLSLIIQLSEPSTYTGCELTLFTDKAFVPPYKEQGDGIMFPSWTPHMVSNIESGIRYSLAIWVSGPQFQ